MFDVHLFNGSAVATSTCHGAYKPGARHALLAFVRQPEGTDHDWDVAEGNLNSAGWTQVKFTRGGTLVAENLTGAADYLQGAFEQAARDGFAFVVYEKPMSEGEE